ncbi:MAG: peptidoglycan editing factor PgeF [Thalassotalea sp.]
MAKKATNPAIEYITLPVAHVQAIQTARFPFTKGKHTCFDSFNLGLHVGDNEASVVANRKILQKSLPKSSQIQWLEQVHSNDVLIIDSIITPFPKADAIITRTPNLALAIMTADCLPILLTNKKGDEIAALHCGWRSTVNNIIDNTLAKMESEPQDIIAWLGPCICQQHFEVGGEVKAAFIEQSPKLARYFIQNSSLQYQADLSGIAQELLKLSGVNCIIDSKECTYVESEKYYSYRRENITGRMASVICINKLR